MGDDDIENAAQLTGDKNAAKAFVEKFIGLEATKIEVIKTAEDSYICTATGIPG